MLEHVILQLAAVVEGHATQALVEGGALVRGQVAQAASRVEESRPHSTHTVAAARASPRGP